MKTLLLILFPIWLSAQHVVTNQKGDTIFSVTFANDTSIVGINVNEITIDIIPNSFGNHLFFVETKDKQFANWFSVYGVYLFRKLE